MLSFVARVGLHVRESTNAGLCGFGPGVITPGAGRAAGGAALAARLGLALCAVASVFLAASPSRAAAAAFEVTKLGGDDSYAIAINDSGQVAGNTTVIEPFGE